MPADEKRRRRNDLAIDYAARFLSQTVTLRIDRSLGSPHPELGFLYPVNYGCVPGTQAPDGEEIDAYVLGPSGPVEVFPGCCRAVIHRNDDDDHKLVVAPDGVPTVTTRSLR